MSCKVFSDSYLKQNGIDAHAVKEEYCALPCSRFDIYAGDTVTIRDKNGQIFADTQMKKEEFFNFYSSASDSMYLS